MREWGSKAVWNFSENSSFLVLSPIPNQCFFLSWPRAPRAYLLRNLTDESAPTIKLLCTS